MKSIALLTAFIWLSLSSLQAQGGFGFLDISYGTINESFIDKVSDGVTAPEVKISENGFGIGGSGLFLINKIAVGGGGGINFISSNDQNVSFDIVHGYGNLGYNLSKNDELIIIPSLRLGSFGNSLHVEVADNASYAFGNTTLVPGSYSLKSGSFSYGVQVDVIKLFPNIPGLAVGISGYFNAPLSRLSWTLDDAVISGIENGDYTHYGVILKIGGGGFFNR